MRRVPLIYEASTPYYRPVGRVERIVDQHIQALSDVEPRGMISLHQFHRRAAGRGELDHYIGVATTQECPAGLARLEVPAATWAVFESVGPSPARCRTPGAYLFRMVPVVGLWGRGRAGNPVE